MQAVADVGIVRSGKLLLYFGFRRILLSKQQDARFKLRWQFEPGIYRPCYVRKVLEGMGEGARPQWGEEWEWTLRE